MYDNYCTDKCLFRTIFFSGHNNHSKVREVLRNTIIPRENVRVVLLLMFVSHLF